MAVSPLNITASAPSSTALATSVTSLRLGLVRSIILSIIWVATITGLARCIHFKMISFCIKGTCSIGTSTPKSPRAIIMPSLSIIISRILVNASGISIFEIIFILLSVFLISLFNSRISLVERTKESATQSRSFSKINSRSAISFSVREGIVSAESGRFTPFFGSRVPPNVTEIFTSFGFKISITFTSIFPSSKKIRSPIFTSLARLG